MAMTVGHRLEVAAEVLEAVADVVALAVVAVVVGAALVVAEVVSGAVGVEAVADTSPATSGPRLCSLRTPRH